MWGIKKKHEEKRSTRGKEECKAPIIHEFLKSSTFSSADILS